MYWFARQKCAANLRASERSDANASVPNDWNSSMWTKYGARFSGRLDAAAHCCELQVRDEERAEQICRLLPYPAFGEVGDENAAMLRRIGEVEFRCVLAKDEPQRRRGSELTNFVENGTRRFGAIPLVVSWVLPFPEARGDGVAYAR